MNSRNCLCFGIHVTVLILLMIQSPPLYAITTEELADICKAMESAFTDISVEYEWSVQSPSASESMATGMLKAKDSSKRKWITKHPFDQRSLTIERGTFVNERGDSLESTVMQSYNGQTAKHLVSGGLLPNGTPINISRGTITERRNYIPPANQTPLAFSVLRLSYVNNNPVPLSERLRKSELVHFDGVVKTINGFNAVRADLLVDMPHVETKPPELHVYFSINHGYTPVKYEYMSVTPTGPEPSFVVDVNELQEVSKGLWFPSSGSMTMVKTNLINTYRATRIVVNQGLKDSDFDIEFSPGTKVNNEVKGLAYVVSAAEDRPTALPENEDTNETKPMQNEKKTEPQMEAKIPSPQNDAQKSKSGASIYIIAGAIVAVLLAVLIIKMYR